MTILTQDLTTLSNADLAAWISDVSNGLTVPDLKRLLQLVFIRLARQEADIQAVADDLTLHEIGGHGDDDDPTEET